mmetsp:Transcript_19425/g.26958  ORF Transcript_19425/g.26958 Transcript_19425/m.26958 type:complete len:385 (-) Transcript_19425:67-1221(-)
MMNLPDARAPHNPAWDLILSASQKNLPEDIRDMVESQGVPPTHSNAVGQTGLHIAALWGHVEALEVLIEVGGDCNAANRMTGATPLHCLVQCPSKGTPASKLACIQALLAGGADPGQKDMAGRVPADYIDSEDGGAHFMGEWLELLTPKKPLLFESRNATEIQALLGKNESLVHATYLGKTALRYICDELVDDELMENDDDAMTTIHNNVEILEVLLKHGANPDGKTNNVEMSLQHEECIDVSDGKKGKSPLEELCMALKDGVVQGESRPRLEALEKAAVLLHDHGAVLDDTWILLDSGRRGLVQFVSFLIEKLNMSPNVQGRQGMTAIQFAARSGRVDMVEYLLSQPNIDISIQDDRGKTALDAARANNKPDIVAILEQHAST